MLQHLKSVRLSCPEIFCASKSVIWKVFAFSVSDGIADVTLVIKDGIADVTLVGKNVIVDVNLVVNDGIADATLIVKNGIADVTGSQGCYRYCDSVMQGWYCCGESGIQ